MPVTAEDATDARDGRRAGSPPFVWCVGKRTRGSCWTTIRNGSRAAARYLEHRLAGGDTRFTYHGGNYDVDLLGDPDAVPEFGETVKGYYGFGRFYGTGAAILRALDLLGAAGVAEAVTEGQSPAEVLIEHLGVTSGQRRRSW